jgi:glycosyltransferase involved in cell wall biosynthesis
MRVLALLTDAYGGRGGIAKFNRELLSGLCDHPSIAQVTALVRLVPEVPGRLPSNLDFPLRKGSSKAGFIIAAARELRRRDCAAVICGHLNLLPVAAAVARVQRAPLILIIHGIEAWNAHANWQVRYTLRFVDAVVSVSSFTKEHFVGWSGVTSERVHVIPNCVATDEFTPGIKNAEILQRHRLGHGPVILTVGRLSASERYKGIDELLGLFPQLRIRLPGLKYLIVGDGDDRTRLEAKALALGVSEDVAFTGHISDAEKIEYYRTADLFVMLSRGEGFGIVYLEALACGLPVLASSIDASREALRGGLLGRLVDPNDHAAIIHTICEMLQGDGKGAETDITYFSRENFRTRWYQFLQTVFAVDARVATPHVVDDPASCVDLVKQSSNGWGRYSSSAKAIEKQNDA